MRNFSNFQAKKRMPLKLKELNTNNDNIAKISLTGLTILKDGQYRSRMAPTPEFIASIAQGIIRKKDYIRTPGEIPKTVKKKKVVTPEVTIPKPKSTRSKEYSINKKQITHRIKNFTNQMPGKKALYFWTVTFPQSTTDHTCFTLLNIWLTRLRKELNLRSYLWISERQQNGTTHFHLTFHQRICVKKANKFMRAAIFNSVKAGIIKFSRKDAKNYNGVDIAKDRKTKRVTNFAKQSKQKSLSNYLTKYVTKNKGTFQHLAWHCSRDYSNLIIDLRFSTAELINWNLRQCFTETAIFEDQFFSFYPWLEYPDPKIVEAFNRINSYIVQQVNSQVTN